MKKLGYVLGIMITFIYFIFGSNSFKGEEEKLKSLKPVNVLREIGKKENAVSDFIKLKKNSPFKLDLQEKEMLAEVENYQMKRVEFKKDMVVLNRIVSEINSFGAKKGAPSHLIAHFKNLSKQLIGKKIKLNLQASKVIKSMEKELL
ncbi:MAG: hypothetical protein HN509_03630 [Halobacteriovoraceae bacterium]|nr:hypothetical protein [Halobacteriovoraceae bacterium]MBT5093715.1 hypothetical protein [Halobacteriovoraceae bacterium]